MTTKVSWHCSRKRKHLRIPYVACLAWKEAQALRALLGAAASQERLLAARGRTCSQQGKWEGRGSGHIESKKERSLASMERF